MDLSLETLTPVARMFLALLFGGLMGFEREWRGKPAGLRTHMMVCLGAATFTLVATDFYRQMVEDSPAVVRMDPLRIIEGIIGGLGFLGAGSIVQNRESVEGLTTAGSLWLVGAIGVAVGGGNYVIAGTAVVAGLVVLQVVGALELWARKDAPGR